MHEIEKLARSKYWRAEQAEVVVEAWRSSEEPATVFGRRWGISADRILRWAKQLDGEAPESSRGGRGSGRKGFAFHRLEVEAALGPSAGRWLAEPESVVADVRVGRWTVAVRSGFDAAELAQVLEMVSEL